MPDEMLRSLRRRIGAMHELWRRGVADLTLEQVNYRERPGVLPIAFSLLHFVRGEDSTVGRLLLDGPSLWDSEGWADRVGVSEHRTVRGTPVAEAEQVRLGDLDGWRAYQAAVFARTEAALDALDPARLEEALFGGGPLPEAWHGSFLSLVVGPNGPARLADMLECFIYQHGIRHLGEVEHARALVGLGGLT